MVKSPTYGGVFGYRHFAVNGDFKPAIESFKKHARVYLLSKGDNPTANDFVNVSGKAFSTVGQILKGRNEDSSGLAYFLPAVNPNPSSVNSCVIKTL